MIDDGFLVHKISKISIQAPEFFLGLECCDRVFSHRVDLQSVADDAWIEEDIFELLICHLRDPFDIPIMEMLSILFPFAEHCDPRESCLSSLQSQELEKYTIIVYRNSPLIVVIVDVELIGGATPSTSSYIFFHMR